ncbi:MAG: hypothetical protein EPN93_18130, partial [Spirochaetes bacterium]
MKAAVKVTGRIVCAALLVLALGTARAHAAGEKKRLAVLDFSANNTSDANARIVRNAFEVMLYKTSLYNMLERRQVELVLKEQGFQASGCVDTACAIEIGKMLSADLVAVGSLDRIDMYIVSVKVIDIANGSVVYADNERSANEGGLYNALELLVARYSGRAAAPEESGKARPEKNPWEQMKEWFEDAEKALPEKKADKDGSGLSWYAGVMNQYTRIGGIDANLSGARGGIVLMDCLTVGVSGMGLTYPTRREKFEGRPYVGSYPNVEMGWGGLLLEYYLFPKERFQLSFGTTIGAGGYGFTKAGDTGDEPDNGAGGSFFLLEPEIGGYITMLRYFRFGVLGSYRYTTGA